MERLRRESCWMLEVVPGRHYSSFDRVPGVMAVFFNCRSVVCRIHGISRKYSTWNNCHDCTNVSSCCIVHWKRCRWKQFRAEGSPGVLMGCGSVWQFDAYAEQGDLGIAPS
ncbi:hypothetical protein MPTK1_4g16500 [Marchantia polymorpha subsp. ruderalis]|uniref:Uncharacterized protein n=2 Tax=Marchantia polymorpha TaxID=3197 RepID=A0AAF6BAJ1_MARPO|nr:hypothetical protein MARPO_0054s0115 [Marchantia polymorpha]BBN09025.1 hypothetical protein Mp_4g16500 [Marchantia polymorpha subsp. ruderalis]|eukprot:PTQ38013.1 hypothetical protein MARPO_0054s0115 [Marchantia polymorpha]